MSYVVPIDNSHGSILQVLDMLKSEFVGSLHIGLHLLPHGSIVLVVLFGKLPVGSHTQQVVLNMLIQLE